MQTDREYIYQFSCTSQNNSIVHCRLNEEELRGLVGGRHVVMEEEERRRKRGGRRRTPRRLAQGARIRNEIEICFYINEYMKAYISLLEHTEQISWVYKNLTCYIQPCIILLATSQELQNSTVGYHNKSLARFGHQLRINLVAEQKQQFIYTSKSKLIYLCKSILNKSHGYIKT